ncbi:ubiquitin ligase complex subunit HRD3 KNAG_0B02660 [Huiozyma naganishii CBS 8797]|uniref:ERAD-associated E3 ubiquitin-protein ligase component HRD3 n=1 Tax=Huiozyma naganishii (strain ATCC MYA-139 / BCRC 22969 / CBS 8797 / KCTC 17520 / NBRC 10181 / NCYC 3082 / Yp74L-3) TaxID=1071383 RepID=J7S3G2_HUIN7|nr:hypothetical protein KNAG_0B02660 [Kazachstania naganishii CBS 8797]CCK68709.1 hypothetical protein KNAG_0B02660 [Kazachstania naganishii CBS 8797]
MLLTKGVLLILISVLRTFASQEPDPWTEAQSLMATIGKGINPIDIPHTERPPVAYTVSYEVPLDYHPDDEYQLFKRFWDAEATEEQQRLSDLLIESTDKYNNTDAAFTLAQCFLYQHYGFPHSKELAELYLNKFNEWTRYSNSTTLFQQGVMYSTGSVGYNTTDAPKGLLYYQRAARLGSIRAKQVLAYKYLNGLNVPRDMNRALLLYRELAEQIRHKYSDEQWNVIFPYTESFNIRLPDFDDGLLGPQLSSTKLSTIRIKSARPDITSSVLTKMRGGDIMLRFNNVDESSSFALGSDLEDNDDQIVDLFYIAWDEYKGTYTRARDCLKARKLLEFSVEEFDDDVYNMESLQRYFYSKTLDLLGHIYFTGEGLSAPDLSKAEQYLKRSVDIIKDVMEIKSRAHIDLALIEQYHHKNVSQAMLYYQRVQNSRVNTGIVEYQMAKIITEFNQQHLGDPFLLMQTAYMKGYPPAFYEFAKMTEQGVNNKYNTEDTVNIFKSFVENSESIMAPELKTAFGELLMGHSETALWLYTEVAEQGFERAQISAAHLMYQIPYKYEAAPQTPDQRKLMAISYYTRAFKQDNIDAGVVAGDIYYNMGKYENALSLYRSAALKYSSQAVWNLGYMYEYGLGVPKDYHLAKRYYDEALEFNKSLLVGVKLSVLKLKIKAWYEWFSHGDSFISTSAHKIMESMPVLLYLQRYLEDVSSSTRVIHRTVVENEYEADILNNLRYLGRAETRHHTPNPDSIFKSTTFDYGDVFPMIIIVCLFIGTFAMRAFTQRNNWNVRVNGVPINRRAPQQQQGQEQEQEQQQQANPPAGNFDIQMFAI